MPKSRDISQLVPDLVNSISKGRTKAAQIIRVDLESRGPYWTGHFAKQWDIDIVPIKPTVPSPIREKLRAKKGKFFDEFDSKNGLLGSLKRRARRNLAIRKADTYSILENPKLYLGNKATYAGFAINNPNATIPVRGSHRGKGKTYAQHINERTNQFRPKVSTAPDGVQWYQVYLASVGISNALSVGFAKAERSKSKVFSPGNFYI